MRTTIDIAEDVFFAVREIARREKKSAGQILSELARRSLQTAEKIDLSEDDFFGFRPIPKRGTVVTNELINRLREEIGD